MAEDCCVFEQPQPVQPGTVVLGRLASAQEKGTPCPRMFGEESNGLAPVNPQTYYICEWMKLLCGSCVWSSLKNTQPAARNVRKATHAIALKIWGSLGWGGLHSSPTQIIKLRKLQWALASGLLLLLWQGFPLRIQTLCKWWEKGFYTTSSLHMTKWLPIPTVIWTE